MRKENAPTPKGEGVVCLHSRADNDASITTIARVQFLVRAGQSMDRAALLSSLVFGEGAHV